MAAPCEDGKCSTLAEFSIELRKEVGQIVKDALEQPSLDIRYCRDFVIAATERLEIGNKRFDSHSGTLVKLRDWKAQHTGEHVGIEKSSKRTALIVSLTVSVVSLAVTVITVYAKMGS